MSKTQSNNMDPLKTVIGSTIFIIIAVFLMQIFIVNSGLSNVIQQQEDKSLFMLGLFVVQEIILLLPVFYFKLKQNISLGFNKQRLTTVVKYVIGGFLTFLFVNSMIMYFMELTGVVIPGYGEQDMRIPLFGKDNLSIFIAGFVLLILAPVTEELLFRGLIFNKLKEKYSGVIAILISAVIFASFHLEFEIFIPLFILGIIIGYIYEKTGTLWTPIAFHVLNNSLAMIEELYLLGTFTS